MFSSKQRSLRFKHCCFNFSCQMMKVMALLTMQTVSRMERNRRARECGGSVTPLAI